NIGAPQLDREVGIGFKAVRDESDDYQRAYERMKSHVTHELRRTFRPEFLNRIDENIVFKALTREQVKEIVNILMGRVKRELRGQNITLEVTDGARELLAKEGFDPAFGARPLRRAIQRLIEDPLSDELLRGKFAAGDTVVADAVEERIVFEKKREHASALKGE
ncbi:MAG: ATP-dependent Clp protease ATP-binding subunit, partial [Armatimonadetes bacterium]|nr:ATP-dependent Clp protease ATP-binding subunit [Armatimonadota bacterium]